MAENLSYNAPGSVCYDNDPSNCETYGHLYDWNTALTVCPAGWHLPSDAEWTTLENAVGGSSIAGTKLKSTSGWYDGNGTNDFGFSALPGGFGRFSDDYFTDAGDTGYWWSATENGASNVLGRYMSNSGNVVSYGYKTQLFSVRCVQD